MLRGLGRNLVCGLRLACLLPIERLAFRVDLAQLLLLFGVTAGLDCASDWIRYGPDALFSWFGAGNEIFSGGVLMLVASVLALTFRQRSLTLAVPLLVLSAYPVLQVVLTLPAIFERWELLPGLPVDGVEQVVFAWTFVVMARSTAIALDPGRRWPGLRIITGGVLLTLPVWLAPMIAPLDPWWRQPTVEGGSDSRYPSPAAEAVLTTQAELLDTALAAIEDETPHRTDLYFVGFAGDGKEDVFRKDVLTAQRVMDERWDTAGRSIALINSPRTLLTTPMATVTHLRDTLNEIGAAMSPDDDVVMIYLTSHGSADHVLEVSLPPLELVQITPALLRTLLDEAGIRWRIIVVSACYSGGFIDALADDQTLIMTAAQADRASFGCGARSDATYFGEALFEDGLAVADSLPAAFDIARNRVAEREMAAGHKPPSNPQISIGSAMADKLKELERGRAGRGPGRTV